MDILKVLAFNNDRGVRETVVSSVLNYFLDPYADHGIGGELLASVLESIAKEVPEVTPRIVAAVRNLRGTSNTTVTVSSEWSGVSEGAERGRRIDSLIDIHHGDEVLLIGIEVKLYQGSASDAGKLSAYATMLSELVQDTAEIDGVDASKVHGVLCYLVPDGSPRLLELAATGSAACRDLGIHGVVVLEWTPRGSGSTASGNVTMEAMIRNVLEKESVGSISPADGQAMSLLRSIRNAALRRFRFDPPTIGGSDRFPTNDEYEEMVGSGRSLLESFRKAVHEEIGRRPLVASSRHTTIGVPAQDRKVAGVPNSLCRIVTAPSYDSGFPAGQFILQFDKPTFESGIQEVRRALDGFDSRAVLTDQDESGEQLYHPNEKWNEPVYRIMFDGPSDDPQEDVTAFRELLRILRKHFLDTAHSQGPP